MPSQPTELKWESDEQQLLERARSAAQAAYCPYSNFPVGAAVETDIGVFAGCNIENASYGLTICAERVALFTAIAAGARQCTRLALSCLRPSPDDPPGSRMPCGACRQVIAEFMAPESIVLIDGIGARRVAELLPEAFRISPHPRPLSHAVGEGGREDEARRL